MTDHDRGQVAEVAAIGATDSVRFATSPGMVFGMTAKIATWTMEP